MVEVRFIESAASQSHKIWQQFPILLLVTEEEELVQTASRVVVLELETFSQERIQSSAALHILLSLAQVGQPEVTEETARMVLVRVFSVSQPKEEVVVEQMRALV
jgi:hypothetical protein